MGVHPMIEAEEGRETAFFFDAQGAAFRTRSRKDEPRGPATPSGDKSKGRREDVDAPPPPGQPRPKGRDSVAGDPVWDIRTPGVVIHDSEVDPEWGLHYPGITSDRVTLSRAFQSLEEVRRAIPEIARRALSHPAKPHVVLAAPHYGELDPAAGLALIEELRRAGAEATVIVQHRSKPGGARHE